MTAIVTPHTDPGAFWFCVVLTFGLFLPAAIAAIRYVSRGNEFDDIEERRAVDRALAETREVRS